MSSEAKAAAKEAETRRREEEDEEWDQSSSSSSSAASSPTASLPIPNEDNAMQTTTTTTTTTTTQSEAQMENAEKSDEEEFHSDIEQFDPDERLDVGLIALLHHELTVSKLFRTAQTLMDEVGLESLAFSGGVPPRLRDLVDLWNGYHDEEFCAPKPKPASTKAAASGATAQSSTTSAQFARKRTPPLMLDLPPSPSESNEDGASQQQQQQSDGAASASTTAAAAGASVMEDGSEEKSQQDLQASKRLRMTTGKQGGLSPAAAASASSGLQRHGPWLVEEEDLLRHALLSHGDANMDEITRMIETRSVNGVAKHLQKIKRGWGQMTNKRLLDVLQAPDPTFEKLMCVKPIDRTEKEMISWLEWFIFMNARNHAEFLEQAQQDAAAQQELANTVTWTEAEKQTLRQILEETDVELLDRFAQRFPQPQIVAFCRQIELQPPLSAYEAKKKRKTKKAVQGRWTIEEGVAFEKVFKETPRNFRALCEAVPLRSRESVALRIRRLNGDPHPRKRGLILTDPMLDMELLDEKMGDDAATAAAAAAAGAEEEEEVEDFSTSTPAVPTLASSSLPSFSSDTEWEL